MASPVSSLFPPDEITLYKPLNQKTIRRIKIGMVAFALILAVGAIVAPFLGLGVTGCILLGIGAAIFLFSMTSYYIKGRKEQKELNEKLLTAVTQGNAEDVKNALGIEKILKGGEMVPRWDEGANVNAKDAIGRTPLMIAAANCAKSYVEDDYKYNDHLQVIAILLKNGADKNIVLFEDGAPLKGVQKVEANVRRLANELQPLYKPTLADRFFKNWC